MGLKFPSDTILPSSLQFWSSHPICSSQQFESGHNHHSSSPSSPEARRHTIRNHKSSSKNNWILTLSIAGHSHKQLEINSKREDQCQQSTVRASNWTLELLCCNLFFTAFTTSFGGLRNQACGTHQRFNKNCNFSQRLICFLFWCL